MLLFQTIIPAVLVFLIFIFGHFFISSSGSGLYISEFNIEIDEPLDLQEDVMIYLPEISDASSVFCLSLLFLCLYKKNNVTQTMRVCLFSKYV